MSGARRYDTAVPVGAGATGEVLRAWDPQLERHVALKFLHRTDDASIERLRREAQALARIDHANVGRVYEVGEENGRPYIAMQFVDGVPLDEAASGLNVEARVLLFRQVVEGVQAAHEAGLLHRDLKPGNVLVETRPDGSLHPVVLDFGIARPMEEKGLTETGQLLGTPGYLSPEQARGLTDELDRRSDVFSLGAMLYELLSESAPFAADSMIDALVKVLQEEVRPLRQIAPAIPQDLETIVTKCLEKDVDQRYSSARELAADLDRFLAGEPVLARPVGAPERLLRLARRHRLATAAVLTALLALLVALGVAVRSRFVGQQVALASQAFGSELVRMQSLLRRDFTLPLHDTRLAQREVSAEMERIRAQLEDLPAPARASARYAVGRTLLTLGRWREAHGELIAARRAGLRDAESSYALGRAMIEIYSQELERLDALGGEAGGGERRRDVEVTWREPALSRLEEALAAGELEEPVDYVRGLVAYTEERWDDAVTLAARSFEGRTWFYEALALEGRALVRRARAELVAGRIDEALATLEEAGRSYDDALQIARSDPAVHAANCARGRLNMVANMMTGEEVEAPYTLALEACRKGILADPDRAAPHAMLGNLQWRRAEHAWDRDDDPEPWIEEAIASSVRSLELRPDHPNTLDDLATAHSIRAQFLASRDRSPLESLESAIGIYRRMLELEPANSYALSGLAGVFQIAGGWRRDRGESPEADYTAAAEQLERAIEVDPIYAWYGNLAGVLRRHADHVLERGDDPSALTGRGIAAGERAVELNAEYYGYWYELARLHRIDAGWAERNGASPEAAREAALTAANRALEIYPEHAASRDLVRELTG